MTTPTVRALCPDCEATPTGCDSLHTLAGRHCCQRCTGNHDRTTNREDTTR